MIKKIVLLFIILFLFVNFSYAEEASNSTQSEGEMVVPKEKPSYGINSIGIQSSVPQPPNLEESQANSRFQPTTSFMYSLGDQVDTSSGGLIINQTDFKLPGKNGLDLEMSRTYRSKQFRSNPKWDLFQNGNQAFIWYGAEAKAYFYPVFPESCGGYIGKGWGCNLFGRLFANYDTKYFKGTIIQIGDQNLIFNNHGVLENKGQYYSLSGGTQGYTLTGKNGIKYHFNVKYYDRGVNHVKHYLFNDEDQEDAASQGFYLSSIEDPAGNMINIVYESFGSTFDEDVSSRSGFLTVDEWQANLMFVPLRPKTIIDSYGRAIDFDYRSSDHNSLKSTQINAIYVNDVNGTRNKYTYVYDDNDCLVEVIPPVGNSTKYIYNKKDEGLGDKYEDDGYILSGMKYPTGANATYNYEWYNPLGEIPDISGTDQQKYSSYIVTSRSKAGSTWSYSYQGAEIFDNYKDMASEGKALGFLKATVIDPLGGATDYEYKNGLVVKEVNPEGHVTDYTWDYDKKNILSIKTNKEGYSTLTEYGDYDDYGNARTVNEHGSLDDPNDDRQTHIEYVHDKSDTYKSKHIVDRIAHQWVTAKGETKGEAYFDYDSSGRGLIDRKREATNSGYATTSYTYDQPGDILSTTDPNGNTTNYTYGLGSPLPTSVSINAEGRTLTLSRSYSPNTGAMLTETDYNGNTSSYSYDPIGRLTAKTNPDGTLIGYIYNDMSNTIDIIDEKGEETTYVYDDQGRLIEVRQPESVTSSYAYNPLSKITRTTDPGGKITSYQYDRIGRLKSVTYADGSSTGLNYRDSQNVVEVTDGNGNTTAYKYDGAGNLAEVTEANGSRSIYSYDCLGDIRGVKDPRGLITAHSWTMNGKLSSVKESDGSVTNFNYDRNGNLNRREDGKGASISYSYDELNRVTSKHCSDTKYNVTYNYDEPLSGNGRGRLTSVDTSWGKTILSYDKMGRIITKSRTIDGKTYSLSYQYDPAGNLIKITDPSGRSTSYALDGLGRVANVKREMNNGNTIIADYQYNPSGTIAGVDYANGTKSSYSYDSRDRVKQIQVLGPDGKMLVKQNMAYDAVGNRSSLFSYNEEEVRYEYDNLNRLTKVNYPKDSEEFKYDASGNRLSLSHAYGKMDYVYDAASNKLEQTNINAHGNIKYTYDGAGNQIKEDWCTGDNLRKSITYKYDPEDRLVGITIAEKLHSGEGTKGSTSEYTYDDSGMRIKKSSLNGTTVYHYDGLDRVIGESDEKGQIKSIHIYANGQRIAEVKTDGNINYFHNDVLGSPVLITDKDAKDIQRYVYEPFGNIVISKGNGENNYIFTGRERDIESNLFYFGARYYNPILGRFISKDVANPKYDDPQTLNRYIYVLNNPIKYYDPDGSYTWPILGLFRITSLYGPRNYLYPGEFHPGIDIAKGMDQPIVSPLSGKVIYSGYLGSLGLTTIIEHRIGLLSFYSMLMHNDALFVVKNQMIKEGQLVSLMGESGLYTNGVHSHYQILTENPFFSDLTKPFYSKENTINPLMFVSLFQDRYSDIGPKEYGLSKTSLMDSFYGPGKSPPNVSLDYPNLNLSIGNNGLGIGFSF